METVHSSFTPCARPVGHGLPSSCPCISWHTTFVEGFPLAGGSIIGASSIAWPTVLPISPST
ncbi:TPA: hypothetical protein N0F65_007874, partial [Lagenidium giganteum]